MYASQCLLSLRVERSIASLEVPKYRLGLEDHLIHVTLTPLLIIKYCLHICSQMLT